jgi:selenoprotein W-related protein
LAVKLLETYERQIRSLELVPSEGGRFEVTVNGELLHSKLASGTHVDPERLMALLDEMQ